MSDWLTDPKKDGWLEPKKSPSDIAPLKSLDDIGDKRQEEAAKPKLEAPIVPVEPLEDIPYDKITTDLENASNDVLASFSRLGRGSVNLSKISIVISGEGTRGKDILSKSNMFKSHIDKLCLELQGLSKEIAEYKNTLPKDSVAKI